MTMDYSIIREEIEYILFGPPYDRRYTQGTPILPDVWMAYARDPQRSLGLILEPERDRRAGEAALAIRDRLREFRDENNFPYKPGRENNALEHKRIPAEIAHLPGVVVLRVYFDELFHVVLPFTQWWQKHMNNMCEQLKQNSVVNQTRYGRLVEAFQFFDKDEIGKLVNTGGSVTNEGFEFDSSSLDSFRLAHVAGLINLLATGVDHTSHDSQDEQLPVKKRVQRNIEKRAQSFLELLDAYNPTDEIQKKHRNKIGSVFQISRNRDAQAAVDRSSVACKADAARLLFNVSCKNITWAVIDSGISHRHPAFHSWREKKCGSRVIETYDFTRLRSVLSLDRDENERKEDMKTILTNAKGAGMTPEEEMANKEQINEDSENQIRELIRRVDEGFDMDWALLEPFIRLDQKDLNGLPVSDHGTHVAGIIGADWPDPDQLKIDEPEKVENDIVKAEADIQTQCLEKLSNQHIIDSDAKALTLSVKTSPIEHMPVPDVGIRKMTGMCPDIRLIDLRVLRREQDPSGNQRSDEFEVIAALQFVRYLNSKAGQIKVHGVNLSLSIEHDISNYACGRTPVCLECEEVVSSGVVVVAAAGNRGYQSGMHTRSNRRGNYQTVSITDPGNASKVITVGATHRYKPHDYGVSYFSSRGPTGDGRRKPDLVAPGEKINAPVRLTEEHIKDGTSMASPHVSGAAAMLMARHPELIGKPERIKKILCDTATDLGREHYFQGNGMLDVLRALQSV